MNYQVIDNFLPNKNFNLIKEMVFRDTFNWFYHPDVTIKIKIVRICYFISHIFFMEMINH